ncbi:hypothetical protein EIN_455420 [Entamoeba invadens IP1]|uniref:Right handed beta helix domain-containing protein n=1 Tax=Entamoeba invadens IP1 TaxID=370355 RepID=L7FP74_ENTIV|nr:hypothetical protein EIN_455420 [Entamoeba invadens IP1]ELP89722.1 hypothetical protein EIN_455420 [Entamoeba invadens IP1]|eukprot:XP_004256493.1 hypothetical protein EIN_455420 [Entamoeba invadens IP1]
MSNLVVFSFLLLISNSKFIQVSPTGSITTLKSACSFALPGDTIEFLTGNYPPQNVPQNTSGTPTNPIIIRPSLNAKLVFETLIGAYNVFSIFNSSNIQVIGPFIVRNGYHRSVVVENSTNITISNLKIFNSTSWAVYATGVNITVKDSLADGCVLDNLNCRKNSWGQCFSTYAIDPYIPTLSQNINYINNEIVNSYGEAIDIILCTDCVVKNNFIHDVFPIAIYTDNARNLVFANNVITFTNHSICTNNSQYHAIAIGVETWPIKCVSTTNITITNNFIYGASNGVSYWGQSETCGYYSDITVSNNVFYNITGAAIAFHQDCLVKGKTYNNQFKNNFVFSTYQWEAALVNKNMSNTWNISANIYFKGNKNILKDTWNGTDGKNTRCTLEITTQLQTTSGKAEHFKIAQIKRMKVLISKLTVLCHITIRRCIIMAST